MIIQVKKYNLRPNFGGNWDNGANCGSRYSKWNNSPLNLNSNNSSRGVADTADNNLPLVAGLNGLLADFFTLLRSLKRWTAKHTATAPVWVSSHAKVLTGDSL